MSEFQRISPEQASQLLEQVVVYGDHPVDRPGNIIFPHFFPNGCASTG